MWFIRRAVDDVVAPRILFVVIAAHRSLPGSDDFFYEKMSDEQRLGSYAAYKTAVNTLCMRLLAKELTLEGILVSSLHIGAITVPDCLRRHGDIIVKRLWALSDNLIEVSLYAIAPLRKFNE
ncbi:hypothetical protein FA95DRAFT_1606352 [Auriscalpium vulgare]|uniref:Uncharacterized protein n=1 Tax=Auriscalpium vulgare TaxID=40419 RepID=A0ACB8RSG4_9AGAM|nr:hypothetical protein FA95DRAFT_1606352 [Auriscalpium vulgare]